MGILNKQIQSQSQPKPTDYSSESILDLELILKGCFAITISGIILLAGLAFYLPADRFISLFRFNFAGYLIFLLTMASVAFGVWYSLLVFRQGEKGRAVELVSAFFYLPFFAAIFLELLHFNDTRLYFAIVIFVFSSLFLHVQSLNHQTFYLVLLFCFSFGFDSLKLDRLGGAQGVIPSLSDLLILCFAVILLNVVLKTIINHYKSHSEELLQERQKNIDYQAELEEIVKSRTLDLIKEKNIAIQESMAKSQFVANMSHELRTPLNAIIGYAELLQEEIIAENIRDITIVEKDLGRIGAAGRNLLQLINNVLDFSKIEANQTTINIVPINIATIVFEAVSLINPLLTKSDNEIHITPVDDHLIAFGDPQKLKQVLINLLGNANKFTHQGSIIISVEDHAETVVISVADTGIGIKEEFIKKLFKPFSQAENEFDRQFEGTGLGLAISKRFMELMNGSIAVQSVYGEGTIFSITIPKVSVKHQIKLEMSKVEPLSI